MICNYGWGSKMKKDIFRKGLVCAVIFLFVSIAAMPAVTSQVRTTMPFLVGSPRINSPQNNELIETTVQLCKPDGLENYTIMLTKEKSEQLDTLIANFKASLDNAKTMNETVEIYNDMIVSLDELGLIPNSMSVEQAQQLVTGSITNPETSEIKKFLTTTKEQLNNAQTQGEKAAVLNDAIASLNTLGLLPQGISNRDLQKLVTDLISDNKFMTNLNEMLESLDSVSNFLCLISGETTNTWVISQLGMLSNQLLFIFLSMIDPYFYIVWYFLGGIFQSIFFIRSQILPFAPAFRNGIILGYFYFDFPPGMPYYVHANGWIRTLGLLGNKTWDGEMYGQLCVFAALTETIMGDSYVGVSGFTGLRINRKDLGTTFYQGFATFVKIGDKPPSNTIKTQNNQLSQQINQKNIQSQNQNQQYQTSPSIQQINQLFQKMNQNNKQMINAN
jgi:hypothetical protein